MRQRPADALRPTKITLDYTKYAEGSVLIETGETKVLCTASFEGSKRSHHIGRCFFQLTAGQFVSNGLCAGFGFLPVPTVVTDVVGSRRITQFPGEVLCKNLGLSDIGEIVRFIGRIIVV